MRNCGEETANGQIAPAETVKKIIHFIPLGQFTKS